MTLHSVQPGSGWRVHALRPSRRGGAQVDAGQEPPPLPLTLCGFYVPHAATSERAVTCKGCLGRAEQAGHKIHRSAPTGAAMAVPVVECCREWIDTDVGYDHCNKAAEFLLWGKLIKPEGLGPRCHEHAARHVGERALGSDLSNWAILDLRGLAREVRSADSSDDRGPS